MVKALKKQVQYLQENGFTEQQDNTLVYFQKDFIKDYLATKKDIALLRSEFKRDIELLKKDLTLRLGSIMVGEIVVLGVFT